MNIQDFDAQLKADNFSEIATVDKPIGYVMGEHQHPFEACALITAGDITLSVNGVETRYGVGEIFHLLPGTPHHESAGLQGVSYRVGRKQMKA
jgi:quercetin dioxygenase-like cupin family protein